MDTASVTPLRPLVIAARAHGLNAAQLVQIAGADGRFASLARANRHELAKLGLTTRIVDWLAGPDEALVAQDLRWLETSGAALVPATSADYPELLRQSPDAPAVLYVRGDRKALLDPQLAMVGSRNPTAGGRSTAREFASSFARAGLTITSGLALGIDT